MNLIEDRPSQTAEAFVKDLGGRVEIQKTCMVAIFNEPDKCTKFSDWLEARGYSMLNVSKLTIAYAAPQVTKKT